jgi:hypothetical protein
MGEPKGADKDAKAQGDVADPAQLNAKAPDPKQMDAHKPRNSNDSSPKRSRQSHASGSAEQARHANHVVGRSEIEMPADYIGEPKAGERYKQEGPVCERPGASGACQLEQGYRHRLIEDLRGHVAMAVATYQAALQNARIDELLKKAPQLGLAAELLVAALGLVGGTLLNVAAGLAVKEINRRAVWNEVMKPGDFEGAVTAQSIQLRGVIGAATGIAQGRAKQAFMGNTRGAQLKTQFLTTLQNQIAPTLDAILETVLDSGDDAALLVANALFDPSVFTLDACSRQVSAMLDRLEKQHLDEIGPLKAGAVPGAGETEVVRLEAFGQHRLAVINFFHRVNMGRMYGEEWYTKSGDEFLNWVDDDFTDFATGAQESRNGVMKTIDVSVAPDRFGPQVSAWVDKMRKARV